MTEEEKVKLENFVTKADDRNNVSAKIIKKLLLDSCTALENIYVCSALNITGLNLLALFNICCEGNISYFNQTMTLIKDGVFTTEQIEENLSLTNPIPFVDISINFEQCSGENNTIKRLEYYKKIVESFEYSLAEAKEKEKEITLNKTY